MILYEDKDIVVCHKPAGIPVQSASVRVKDMVSMLKYQTGGEIYVVHRLDQPVEGVLVFAKTKRAASDLSRQIADGSMRKIYQAIVEMPDRDSGRGTEEESEWHTLVDYLVKDAANNLSFAVDEKEAANVNGAKRAELRYRILKEWIEKAKSTADGMHSVSETLSATDEADSMTRALVEIDLKTGRHHQIRVQMAHAGMPLVGDRKYNSRYRSMKNQREHPHGHKYENKYKNKYSDEQHSDSVNEEEKLALCAVSLTFRHPVTKKKVMFTIQPDKLSTIS